ncbi:MAG: hypothetical protein AAF985_23120 [Bacteroidota bacterium]
MPNEVNDSLFRLVKSLTKAEKRNFRFYVNRVQKKGNIKFVQLFDVLDKQKRYDEQAIFIKIPDMKRQQLSNTRRHLYRQILASLRLINIQKNIDIEIREQIDFARILYGKGLPLDSLRILDRVKNIALNAHQDLLHLEIIEFEKLIEARHITRSIENRADQLAEESQRRTRIVTNAGKFSNLALRLYGLYIKVGHTRNEKDYYMVKEFFHSNLPSYTFESLTFFEKIYLCECYVWYNHILQNFLQNYKYAQRWVDLFNVYPDMKAKDPDLYMRGLNNLLSALFHINYHSRFCEALDALETFGAQFQDRFNKNSEVQFFLYVYTHRINKHFMEGSFTEGLTLMPDLEKKLEEHQLHLDRHRILVFYYKMACMYFSSGDNKQALEYLNEIINLKAGTLREDIQCYARLLHLIAHYELENYNLLEYLVKSVYRFLHKMEDLNHVQKEILKFLRLSLNSLPEDLKIHFIRLRDKLVTRADHPYERRSFLYLDIISWLDCKIKDRPVQEIIQANFKQNRR